jgi:hypothetical protein
MTTVTEKWNGRKLSDEDDNPTASITYYVEDAATEDVAIAAVKSETDEYKSFAGTTLRRVRVTLDEMVIEDSSWWCTAYYEESDIPEEDEPEPTRTWSTTGGTEHITQSLETMEKGGAKVADFKQAIGFDGENVRGVDITVPVMTIEEIQYKTDDEITSTYVGDIFRATGKINETEVSSPYGVFQPGELLFLGANGSKREDDIWEVTYRFAGLPNRTNFAVGDLTITSKRGWDYLWLQYEADVDEAAGDGGDKKAAIRKPVAYYVERVYEEIDFTDLDLDGWSI